MDERQAIQTVSRLEQRTNLTPGEKVELALCRAALEVARKYSQEVRELIRRDESFMSSVGIEHYIFN